MVKKDMTTKYKNIDFLTFNVIDDTLRRMFRENYESMLPGNDQIKPCDRNLVAHIRRGSYENA